MEDALDSTDHVDDVGAWMLGGDKRDGATVRSRLETEIDTCRRKVHKIGRKDHPVDAAPWYSRLTWSWFTPLLRLASKTQLNLDDVWELPESSKAEVLLARYNEHFSHFPLPKALRKMFWKRWVTAGLFYGGWCCSAGVQPWLVYAIVAHLKSENPDVLIGVLYAMLLFVSTLGYNLFINHKFHQLTRNGIAIRNLLMGLIYRKILRIAESENASLGEATNLMSNDCERIFEGQRYLHYMWASPMFVCTVVGLATAEIGPAALVGFGMLLVLIPIQIFMGKAVGVSKRKMMPETDERTELTSQVLSGIQVVKAYNWSLPFSKQIRALRNKEMKHLTYIQNLRAVMRTILFIAPTLVPFVTMVTYEALGNTLTLEVTFLTISFVSILRFPLLLIPTAYSLYFEMRVSLARIESFLALREVPPHAKCQPHHPHQPKQPQQPPQQLSPTHAETPSVVSATSLSSASITPSTTQPTPTLPPPTDAPLSGINSQEEQVTTTTPITTPTTTTTPPTTTKTATTASMTALSRMNSFKEPVTASSVAVTSASPLHIGWKKSWWDKTTSTLALDTFQLKIERGELVGVMGPVGAGKTAFLLSLLREIELTDPVEPDIDDTKGIAYFAQEPGILNATLEENVCFGLPFDEVKFAEVAEAACLTNDIRNMHAGTQTEIGDQGVNLSGGQKARVAFARALYHRDRCSLFLFDDPFSSVDANVAQTMFKMGILGYLEGCTCVFVVNSMPAFLDHAHVKLLVANGKVTIERRNGTDVIKKAISVAEEPRAKRRRSTVAQIKAGMEMTSEETRAKGAVTPQVFLSYFGFSMPWRTKDRLHSGAPIFAAITFMYIVGQILRVMCDVWLAWWAEAVDLNQGDFASKPTRWWTNTLVVWNVVNVVFAYIRSYICVKLSVNSSEGIHDMMLTKVLAAPLLYFQQNAPGKMLNRFSSDLHRVDLLLPDMLYQFMDNLFVLITAVLLAMVAVPWLLLLLFPFGILLYFLQRYQRNASRELLRLDGTSKTPLYGLFSESMRIRSTIRAFGMQATHLQRAFKMADANLKAYLAAKLLEQWLSMYLNLGMAILSVSLVLVAVCAPGSIDPALVGLSLVYCLQLMGLSSWTVMMFVQVESFITSHERCLEICKVHGQEDDQRNSGFASVHPSWPQQGKIQVIDCKLQYRPELPLALNGVNFTVDPTEKIGICGRTGAGKSSILIMLFRLFEPLPGTQILIDGVDILTLDLSTLRDAIAIIPQDPVLFSGSVRMNLDPFGRYSDVDVWTALERVSLKEHVTSMTNKLDEHVGGGGSSQLSFGQKQLMCIARALLKPSKILLCDEATSSVDRDTDKVIQRIIRSEFKDRTVLTIAHRIETVLDSDKIIVMDGGVIAEHDTPANLISDGGMFAQMVKASTANDSSNDNDNHEVRDTDTECATHDTHEHNDIDDNYTTIRNHANGPDGENDGGNPDKTQLSLSGTHVKLFTI
eukprot:m.197814 g.197814  ORF g.197814 m.197814 type:complete len:1463 (-) comp32668_c0_seq4:261-4649(-)